MARLPVSGDERLLDVGCGTGALLKTLSGAYPGLRLAGVDPTSEMLAVALKRLEPDVRLEEAWAEKLPFRDDHFDVVVSCNIFHYIREPTAALHETARVLKPGGLFLMTDWCHDFLSCRVCDLYLRLFSRAHFKTYRLKECCDMLSIAGFDGIEIERYKINWLWGLMTAASYKSAAS
ncbi:MAG: class I SAM-dependent methyltransferase [Thermodesulfobacteriota bacterium]